jgi:hypothetical protein
MKLSKSNRTALEKQQTEKDEDELILNALEKIDKDSGVKAPSVAERLVVQTASSILPYWGAKDRTVGQRLELAASSLAEMEPSNAIQSMLANQMIAVNDAALLFTNQASQPESTPQKRSEDTERACRFLSLFIQQVDAMQRLKGKTGRQKVTVEHVNVHAGGQAIVGEVNTGRGDGGRKTDYEGDTP